MKKAKAFDKYGRPIEDEELREDGSFIRVPLAFMDGRTVISDEGERARDAYIKRMTGHAPRPTIKPMRDSQRNMSVVDARRAAARDAYIARMGVI